MVCHIYEVENLNSIEKNKLDPQIKEKEFESKKKELEKIKEQTPAPPINVKISSELVEKHLHQFQGFSHLIGQNWTMNFCITGIRMQ